MTRRPLGPSTTAIHGEAAARKTNSPVTNPVVQSATFVNAVGSDEEVLYTRYGNNPNQLQLANRLSRLEGSEDAIFLASGMGATALAHLAVLNPGDHLLSSNSIYGGTRRLFEEQFRALGIDISFVDPTQPGAWEFGLRETTRAVFVETPTNPLARVLDIEPLVQLCRAKNLALLVDSTLASPINFRPLEHGADIVIHSATKYLNGHSDVIAGAVASRTEIVEKIRRLMQVWGQVLDPHAAWLVIRGLKTLAVRIRRHNDNGLAFARWAAGYPKIVAVHYPGLEGHPDHDIAKRILHGFGGMVGIEVAGGTSATEQALRKLRLAFHAPSLGGVETLVSEPRFTSHADLTADERAAQGIPDGFIRVSVGIEDVEDILADFEQALDGI